MVPSLGLATRLLLRFQPLDKVVETERTVESSRSRLLRDFLHEELRELNVGVWEKLPPANRWKQLAFGRIHANRPARARGGAPEGGRDPRDHAPPSVNLAAMNSLGRLSEPKQNKANKSCEATGDNIAS